MSSAWIPGFRTAQALSMRRALIEASEDFARAQGATCLHIGVLAANRGARELYRSSGYEPFAMRREKHL